MFDNNKFFICQKKNFQKIAFIVETTHFHFIVKKTDRQADRQISERYQTDREMRERSDRQTKERERDQRERHERERADRRTDKRE